MKYLLAGAMLAATVSTNAEMINLSSNNYANFILDKANIACTIINGTTTVVITVESSALTANAALVVVSPDMELFRVNYDWLDLELDEQTLIIKAIGRPLNKGTDSALALTVTDRVICAYAGDEIQGVPMSKYNLGITQSSDARQTVSDPQDAELIDALRRQHAQ